MVDGTYDEAVERSATARELAPGLGHVLARLRAYATFLGDRRLLDDAVGDRRRAEEEKRRRTRPRGRASRRRRLRRRRGPSLSPSRALPRPKLMSVEPASADCLFESVAAGRIVSVPGPHDSIMSGLNCGRISLVAWPTVSRTIDLSLPSTTNQHARQCAWRPDQASSRETGAAGLGGLLEILRTGERRCAGRQHRQGDPCPALQLRGRHRPRCLQKDNGRSILFSLLTDSVRLPFAVSKVTRRLTGFSVEPSAVSCGRSRARISGRALTARLLRRG